MIKNIDIQYYLKAPLKIILLSFLSLSNFNNISLKGQTLELPEIVSGEVLESITGRL